MGYTFWPVHRPQPMEPTKEEEQILAAESKQRLINEIVEQQIELQQGAYAELRELGVSIDDAKSICSPECVATGFLPD